MAFRMRKAMNPAMITTESTLCPNARPTRAIRVVGSSQPYFQQVVHCEGVSTPRCSLQYEGSGPREVVIGLSSPAFLVNHRELKARVTDSKRRACRCPGRLRRPPGATLLDRPA